MNTRRRGNNYSSPYGQPAPDYPSQSSGYIPMHLGGQNPSTAPRERNQRNFQGNPFQHRSGNRGYGGERYPRWGTHTFGHNERGSGNNTNKNFRRWPGGSYRSSSPQHRHQHMQRFAPKDHFSSYFHRSMLEDPWKELMERHNALNSSIFDDIQAEDKYSDTEEPEEDLKKPQAHPGDEQG